MERSRLKQIIKEELDRALSESKTGADGYPLAGARAGGDPHPAMGGPIPADYVGEQLGPQWTRENAKTFIGAARAFTDAFESDENVGMQGYIASGMLGGGDVSGTYSMQNDGLNYTANVNLTFFGITVESDRPGEPPPLTTSGTGSDLDPYEAVHDAINEILKRLVRLSVITANEAKSHVTRLKSKTAV